jgi:hypothetical protein
MVFINTYHGTTNGDLFNLTHRNRRSARLRGVFGSNVAMVLRRLQEFPELYLHPQIILHQQQSNPKDLASRLTGKTLK